MILNEKYDFETTRYRDIPEVNADAIKVLEMFKFLGIKDEHITRLKDTNYNDLLLFRSKIEGIFRNA